MQSGPFVPGAPSSTAAQDEATQDVPPNVEVLDNGRARAPTRTWHGAIGTRRRARAAQKFHTAFNSLIDFADGILELQEAGSAVTSMTHMF